MGWEYEKEAPNKCLLFTINASSIQNGLQLTMLYNPHKERIYISGFFYPRKTVIVGWLSIDSEDDFLLLCGKLIVFDTPLSNIFNID